VDCWSDKAKRMPLCASSSPAAAAPASTTAWRSTTASKGDFIFNAYGVKVVVDPLSINYLRGASVDYVEDMMGGGFKIDNPNATRSCGCGSSFSTEDGDAEASGGGCGSGGCGSGGCGSH
jgi:iron-sulfur cluster assembly protein